MSVVGRASVPRSAVVLVAKVRAPAEPAVPPAEGCVGGKKRHRWIAVSFDSHARVCGRGCGARGWLDYHGQVKRVDESVDSVRQASP